VKEFEGALAFAEHLVKIAVATEVIERKALGHALEILEEDMRAQIGEYQDAVGPYPAWAPLAESTEEQKAMVGAPANAPLERFGDLEKRGLLAQPTPSWNITSSAPSGCRRVPSSAPRSSESGSASSICSAARSSRR
jgi:hypothetical protein